MVGYIYTGRHRYWNAPNLVKQNPNVDLPDELIKPIARFDADDSTGLFTQLMSASSSEWNLRYGVIYKPKFVNGTCCNSTKWPSDIVYMYGNMIVGMVGLVASIPYSIGYASLPSLSSAYNIDQATLISKFLTGSIRKHCGISSSRNTVLHVQQWPR